MSSGSYGYAMQHFPAYCTYMDIVGQADIRYGCMYMHTILWRLSIIDICFPSCPLLSSYSILIKLPRLAYFLFGLCYLGI
jgi:hypothetical protein